MKQNHDYDERYDPNQRSDLKLSVELDSTMTQQVSSKEKATPADRNVELEVLVVVESRNRE